MQNNPQIPSSVTQVEPSLRNKPAPRPENLPVAFSYIRSADDIEENLLILFHGFGDTHVPFAKLGRSLKLPQTSSMSVRGPELIPFLAEDDPEGYQWYPIYDDLGEDIRNPNPSAALEKLVNVIKHLVDDCKWQPSRIHLFGFGQGGTVASELALAWAKQSQPLGSTVTVSGPLLSYPTISSCTTAILCTHRPSLMDFALSRSDLVAFRKGFKGRVVEEALPGLRRGMPASSEEWLPIMRFWSEVLSTKAPEGTVEVIRNV